MAFQDPSIQRALFGSPLRRPLVGRLLVMVLTLIVTLGVLISILNLFVNALQGLEVYLTAQVLSILASIPAIAILWYLDRRERESPWLFAGLLLWGAAIAAAYSLTINTAGGLALVTILSDDSALSAAIEEAGSDVVSVGGILIAWLIAPPVEELAKGLAILLVFWFLRSEFDGVRDGIIYGALVGLGFNMLETAQYIVNIYALTGAAPYWQQIATRFVFLGLDGHALYSALFGAGLGLALQTRRRWLKILAPVCGLGMAILAHLVNNSLTVVFFALIMQASGLDIQADANLAAIPVLPLWFGYASATLITQFPFYILIALSILLSGLWEQKVIRKELEDEIGKSITPEEYKMLLKEPLCGLRTVPGYSRKIARAIVNAQNELAFRKLRIKNEGGEVEKDPLARAWREDISRLRRIEAQGDARVSASN
jgi:RsiW-degrading membrane proteinase PrsW (M82 family)